MGMHHLPIKNVNSETQAAVAGTLQILGLLASVWLLEAGLVTVSCPEPGIQQALTIFGE